MNPFDPSDPPPSDERLAEEASNWIVRRDRGLRSEEQDAFLQWLGRSPRHRTAYLRQNWGWEELDRLAGMDTGPVILGPAEVEMLQPQWRPALRHVRRAACWALPLAAAAAIVLFLGRRPGPAAQAPASAHAPRPASREEALADGSLVELNRGARVAVDYTAAERHVLLVKGEAHFDVAKDKSRPFVVTAAGVKVQALGTAFDVRIEPNSVDIVVNEGHVSVIGPDARSEAIPVLLPGQAVSVALTGTVRATPVQTLSTAELDARLDWRPRLLDFTDATLAQIALEFNRYNPGRPLIADPSLVDFRLSASFRADNVDGFVRLLGSQFDIVAERQADGAIRLRRGP